MGPSDNYLQYAESNWARYECIICVVNHVLYKNIDHETRSLAIYTGFLLVMKYRSLRFGCRQRDSECICNLCVKPTWQTENEVRFNFKMDREMKTSVRIGDGSGLCPTNLLDINRVEPSDSGTTTLVGLHFVLYWCLWVLNIDIIMYSLHIGM